MAALLHTPVVASLPLATAWQRLRLLRAGLDRYAGDQNFVMPLLREQLYALDPKRNALLQGMQLRGFLAQVAGRPVARVVVRVGPDGLATFSHFENAGDAAVAVALFAEAARWATEAGARRLQGPVGIGAQDAAGVLTHGFVHAPTTGTPYNPPDYGDQLARAGFSPRWRLPGWRWDLPRSSLGAMAARLERLQAQHGVTLRPARLDRIHDELGHWFDVLGGCCREPWRPRVPESVRCEALACELSRHALPGMVLFAEHAGVPCGVVVTVPDVNRIVPRGGLMGPLAWARLLRQRAALPQGRVRFLIVRDDQAHLPIPTILLLGTAIRAIPRGISRLELSCGPEEDHALMRAAREIGARRAREFSIFSRSLEDH